MATSREANAIECVVDRLLAEPDIGGLRIVGADGALSTGSDDEPVVRLTITLRDPDPGADTWPTEDVWRLRKQVDLLIWSSDTELPRAVIDLQPETPDDADER